MLKVDVEGGQIVDSETVDLGNVVFIARQCARRWSARGCDILDEPGTHQQRALSVRFDKGRLLFEEILEFLRDFLPHPVDYLGHRPRHGISRSIPIRASHADDFVVCEAFDVAECSVAFRRGH